MLMTKSLIICYHGRHTNGLKKSCTNYNAILEDRPRCAMMSQDVPRDCKVQP